MQTNHRKWWLICGLLSISLSATSAEQCISDQALITKQLFTHHGKAFKIYSESYEIPGGFENPAHYHCLYFNDVVIGKVGPVSFSPKGNYIVFNSADEGTWKLMDLKGKTRNLGRVKSFQYYKGIKWAETESNVTILYDKDTDSNTFDL